MNTNSTSPIGIFDSGIGGLTVVKAIMKALPTEHIIYFGDTARVPYGIKSPETIRTYALQIADFLLEKEVKMVLIACNSVASVAVDPIRYRCAPVPVLDVIEAGVASALQNSNGRSSIGVIGTLATISSGAYERALQQNRPGLLVTSKACPLLVPLAEEGWTDNHVAREVLSIYLERFKENTPEALILGCTHYPLFKNGIRNILGPETIIVDSAESIATMTSNYLRSHQILNLQGSGQFECYVSDEPQRFRALAERFLGQKLGPVHIISLRD